MSAWQKVETNVKLKRQNNLKCRRAQSSNLWPLECSVFSVLINCSASEQDNRSEWGREREWERLQCCVGVVARWAIEITTRLEVESLTIFSLSLYFSSSPYLSFSLSLSLPLSYKIHMIGFNSTVHSPFSSFLQCSSFHQCTCTVSVRQRLRLKVAWS